MSTMYLFGAPLIVTLVVLSVALLIPHRSRW